jgi:hypothetical protein
MPGWTRKSFDDLEDRSPAGVPMRWRFSRDAVRSTQVGVSRFTYEPGARIPYGHRHRGSHRPSSVRSRPAPTGSR